MNRRHNPAALAPLLTLVLFAGACAGRPPADPVPLGEPAGDELWGDDSADGSGAPAGVAELLGEPLPPPEDPAPGLGDELRAQFGGVFFDATEELPGEVVDEVARYVGYFHDGRARANYERWLAREGRYRDLILAELRAQGAPEELLYLAMLESGFSPVAVSRARATGLWQFMRATGRQSGLRIDDWVDERRDPIASTRAAIRHLRVLHRELGDWALAAAAYNAGLGRVRRAQRRAGGGYFQLTAAAALPAETRSYIPLILAAGHVAVNRERYGLGHIEREAPLSYDTVRVEGRTRLSAVARATGQPLDRLRALNTHLIRGAAPPGRSWVVRLPPGTLALEGLAGSQGIAARVASLPTAERLLPEWREVVWTVRSGDSWWKIANRHGTTVKAMRALNPRAGEVIHPGQKLVVSRTPVYDG